MNISALTIYFWRLADSICGTLIILSVLSAVFVIVVGFFYGAGVVEDEPELSKKMRPYFVRSVWAFGLLITATTLCPNSNTIAMMVVIPKIANSKVIQQDVPELYEQAIKALKDALPKTEPK